MKSLRLSAGSGATMAMIEMNKIFI